jgi:hypothetical protein
MILERFADRSMPKTNEFKGLSVATPAACALGPRTQAREKIILFILELVSRL